MSRANRERLMAMLTSRADWTGDGDLTEQRPLECLIDGEPLSARVYRRVTGAYVFALDLFVDDAWVSPWLTEWIATRSGVSPFSTIRLDRDREMPESPARLLVSHTLLADDVTDAELDETLSTLIHVARRTRRRVSMARPGDPPCRIPNLDDPDDPDDLDDLDDLDDGPVVSTPPAARDLDAILAELDALVGLDDVKEVVHGFVADRQIGKKRRARGMQVVPSSPHLVFVGNPGTGKTTVARLVGELYRTLGLLPSGHLVEADRSALVAAYLGQTAIKTRHVCEQALGGVLFIDEAYSLAGERDMYGEEAITTLLAFMENHRNEFAVVVAGYPEEMERFIQTNPGLRARFDITIEFPDYTTDELEDIFLELASRHDYVVPAATRARLHEKIASWPRTRGFGNGREARKLFHEVVRRHNSLLVGQSRVDTAALSTIPPDAIPHAEHTFVPPRRPTWKPGYL